MAEPWPDLTGDCPDDWDPLQWTAAQGIHEGKTLRRMAKVCKVSDGTVSRWKRAWKDRYGDEFLKGDRARNLPKAREIASSFSRGSNQNWPEVRAAASSANGVTADYARELAQMVLLDHINDPAKRAELTVTDALTLARLADMLEKRADELAGATGGESGGHGGDEVPEGLLADFDIPEGDEVEELFAIAAESAATFLHLVDTSEIPADGVIETTGERVA